MANGSNGSGKSNRLKSYREGLKKGTAAGRRSNPRQLRLAQSLTQGPGYAF